MLFRSLAARFRSLDPEDLQSFLDTISELTDSRALERNEKITSDLRLLVVNLGIAGKYPDARISHHDILDVRDQVLKFVNLHDAEKDALVSRRGDADRLRVDTKQREAEYEALEAGA